MSGFLPLKPTIANGITVPAQNLAVGSSTESSFAAFNSLTNVVAIQVLGGNVYCTLDGTSASASNGGILYAGQSYHWDAQTAMRAGFLGVSSGAVVYAQECVSAGTSSMLPDMSIFKGPPF